jgi:hypothetical protein
MVALLLAVGVLSSTAGTASPGSHSSRTGSDCVRTRRDAVKPAGGMVIASAPLRLVSLLFYDRSEMKPVTSTFSGGKHYWPGKYDLLPMSGVRTQWEPVGDFTSADVTRLIASDCYRTTVELNGVSLGTFNQTGLPAKRFAIGDSVWFGPCPQGKRCLYLGITQAAWAAAKPPWVLDIRITRLTDRGILSAADVPAINEYGDVVPNSPYEYRSLTRSRATILPNPQSAGSYFLAKVWPTFLHARCQNCHALGSVDALISRHDTVGYLFKDQISSVKKSSSPTGPVITCNSGCHAVGDAVPGEVFEELEWKAPAFERDINWGQMNAILACARVKTNLPTMDKARRHFFEDARIAWAVNSGIAPLNRHLGKAPPGSFAAWKELLEPWLWGMMPCPTQ